MGAEITDELSPEYDLRELLAKGVLGKYAERYRVGTNHRALLSSRSYQSEQLRYPSTSCKMTRFFLFS